MKIVGALTKYVFDVLRIFSTCTVILFVNDIFFGDPAKSLYSARHTQKRDHNGMSLRGRSTWFAMSGLWARAVPYWDLVPVTTPTPTT